MIKYENVKLKNLNADHDKNGLVYLEANGQMFRPTKRFWHSMAVKYHFNDKFFNLFSPKEVFDKIKENNDENANLRISYENRKDKLTHKMLAISNPNEKIFEYEEIKNYLQNQGGENIQYNEGILSATFTPQGGDNSFSIGLDDFEQRYDSSFCAPLFISSHN